MARPVSLRKLILFSTLPALAVAAAAYGVYQFRSPRVSGRELNRSAWERTYTERGLPVPPQGPREGYWGARLGPTVADPELGWHHAAVEVDGLLQVDAEGLQQYLPDSPSSRRVMILGGSVAFGAYASGIPQTYYHVLGVELQRNGTPAEILVIAAGAWKAKQELAALEKYLPLWNPQVVVFLDGLNDLTSGARSQTLYGEQTQTHDGSVWSASYHARDYPQRVADYLQIIQRADELCRAHQAELLVVLQPSLAECSRPTDFESMLLARSAPESVVAAHRAAYDLWRQQLPSLLRSPQHFLDASRIFDSQHPTTFTDQWHFSDPGHEILGRAIAQSVVHVFKRQDAGEEKPVGSPPH